MTTLYGREALELLTSSTPDFERILDGKQEKYNHVDCPAGDDTKQRLYVKHVDGAILFHCHHCDTSGYYRPRERYSSIADAENRIPHSDDARAARAYETIGEEDYNKFRIEGQLWLGQYGFDAQMCHDYGIKEFDNGLVLPVYFRDIIGSTRVDGYQIRRYNGVPKYSTYTQRTYSYLYAGPSMRPLVITEDLLSSYKMHAAGFSTLCLLGTSMPPEVCSWVARDYPRQVLWLDDDKGGHHGALKIIKEFSVLMPELTAIFHKQPKEIDLDDLMRMEL